jgi:hypothetical protein
VTWLAGPLRGKTTLVSGYLETHQRPGIWYDTDAGDDPAAFFTTWTSPRAHVSTFWRPLSHLHAC